MIVTVTPNASLDLTYQLPAGSSVRPIHGADHVHRADWSSLEASGKGVNVSRILARAGVPTIAVLTAGGSTGEQLVRLLERERVEHRCTAQIGVTRINTTILGDGAITQVTGPGSAATPGEVDDLVRTVAQTLDAVRTDLPAPNGSSVSRPQVWLAICGSFTPATDVGLMARLIMTARAAGVRCAVDTSGAGLASALTAGADLLAPNLEELAQVRPALWPVLGQSTDEIRLQVTSIAADDGCELLVSMGADGAIWTDGAASVHVAAEPVIAINTAGAGDALLAGWLAGYADPDPATRLRTAVAWATAACLASTTVAGPAP